MISKVKPMVANTGDKKDWFETWFDSPYYHILYKERDETEAEIFLDKLISHIKLSQGSKILDVACGKGRHSLYLNKKGFDVTGYDLSEQSIKHNLKMENDTLHFYLHDMRELFRTNYFDLVLNLFSSFGYFDKAHDNFRCLQSHVAALKQGGLFIIDYFNTRKIIDAGDMTYEKIVDDISFHIEKKLTDERVIKEIKFTDNNINYTYEEHVALVGQAEFESYFKRLDLKLISTFGNYNLDKYDPSESDRMIFLTKKN
ncbi:MAG: class I SAM-dependent methyltransferase [Bacteroidetes bacterium]|nr:MAG: class I SAM-dependent methyltransferase [Bacteroidota bacterium]